MPKMLPWVGRLKNSDGKIYGTGFLVHASGLIATAYHVVQNVPTNIKLEFELLTYAYSTEVRLPAQVAERYDLAVLQATNPVPSDQSIARLVSSQDLENGTSFLIQAYGQLENESKIAYLNAMGTLKGYAEKDGVQLLQLSSQEFLQGMSGGPICTLDSPPMVFGVLSQRYISSDAYMEHLGFATPVERLLELNPMLQLVNQPLPTSVEVEQIKKESEAYIMEKYPVLPDVQIEQLARKFLACPSIRDTGRRTQIVHSLPDDISLMIETTEVKTPLQDMKNILNACLNRPPDGINLLVERLAFYDRGTYQFKDLIAYLQSLSLL